MSGFISLITSLLSIPLSLGTFNTNIGEVLAAILIIRYAFIRFFGDLQMSAEMDRRGRSHGFENWEQYQNYENYMGGGDRHKDGYY